MTLDRAIEIAREAHAGQLDKGGKPYIEHCLRVMDAMETEEEKIVAVLHDVLEDGNGYWPALREGLNDHLLEAIMDLRRLPRQSYREYIAGLASSPIARRVKIADLKDNMDLSRIPNPTAKDLHRMEKYRINLAFLEQKA